MKNDNTWHCQLDFMNAKDEVVARCQFMAKNMTFQFDSSQDDTSHSSTQVNIGCHVMNLLAVKT